jgi:hypothetical protein
MAVLDARVPIDSALDAFGAPAVVCVPGGTTVSTRAMWLPPRIDQVPTGAAFQRTEALRVLVLPIADLPQVPRGTRITAAEIAGGPARAWIVDGRDADDVDHVRVVVRRLPDPEGA